VKEKETKAQDILMGEEDKS